MSEPQSEIHVFTSAALNYLPKVRLLFRSLREHHPEWKLHLALADELPPDLRLEHEPLDSIVSIAELGISDWKGWSFCHQLVELATAIKPFMLARLLKQEGCSRVLYLDPDIVVFSPLDDIIAALAESSIVLTPHQAEPETELAEIIDNEICSLKHGVYNLGFIGVAATDTGHAFAAWWSRRLYHFCRDDIPNGLFTDQRWIDLVPALFPAVGILRSPRFNAAAWNLSKRELSRDPQGKYCVNGKPLGFYHFTGFDSGAHLLMVARSAPDNAAIQELITWYQDESRLAAQDALSKSPWYYGSFSDGTPILAAQRYYYRDHPELQQRFPDPYEATTYLAWWRDNGDPLWPASSIPPTPGFSAGKSVSGFSGKLGVLRRAATNPAVGKALGKRAWDVYRSEGIKGIVRRLKR